AQRRSWLVYKCIFMRINTQMMARTCENENCSNPIEGRSDRRFCSVYCKTDFHYQKRKQSGKVYFKNTVDDVIRRNRRILQDYNLAGKTTVRKSELLNKGFNPRFITHWWKKS